MNNQSECFKKSIARNLSAISLGIVLLVSPSLATAQGARVTPAVQEVPETKQQVVNINKSTFEQLVSLKGVGHTKAQAIIVYRQEVGGFKSINELTNVSGIGEKIVSQNKTRLSL